MRILIYSYNYYPEPIGIAPLMTELAEGLVKRGHEVRVITAMPWYPAGEIFETYRGKLYCTEEINGVTVQRCYVRISKNRNLINRGLFELSFMLLSFLQALRGWRPNVILMTVPGLPVGVPAAVLGFLYRCPVVLNLQDILPDAAIQVGLLRNPVAVKIFKALEKFNYLIATKITVISEGFIENLTQKNVDSQKICLIPNWVDVNFIRPLDRYDNAFRAEHKLGDKFVVLYSGNIALTQPLINVIDAARKLAHLPEIVFVIVGPEDALHPLRRRARKRNLQNVQFLTFQPRAQLPTMLAAANVGLVVQKFNVVSFNMPSKIQVLLASGCPILAAVPEEGTAAMAIRASGGGVLVPPENAKALAVAVEALYRQPEELERLGQKGRQHAIANYACRSAIDRYEDLFLKLIQPEPCITVGDEILK
ncbi:glycosyltransferase family 4 protein [Spirulina major]|uniref:glycosyltransferase family 4 protein n=1 Tax=Spirulina major TaxID=270636 RepID=UPI0009334C64|nr:glycosyltransferase family 4 protein [Spirulina major]